MIKQEFRAELLGKNGAVKCPLNLMSGQVNCNSKLAIKKGGDITFMHPDVSYREESTPPPLETLLTSATGKKFMVGVDSTGILYTKDAITTETSKYTGRLKVDDTGVLFVDDTITTRTLEMELRNTEGYYYNVYVTGEQGLESENSTKPQFVYYTEKVIQINWLTDRVRLYYNNVSLGVYMMISPQRIGDLISTDLMDLNILIQRKRPITPVVFQKGTNYQQVLQYFIISTGYTKFSVQATNNTLATDIVVDSSKNNLEWFNEIAKQINYTDLTVDNNGYFISQKYVQPSPSNVKHTYSVDKKSVIVGGFDLQQDLWRTPNIIIAVVENPKQPIMRSVVRNDNPSDEFSTYNIGEVAEVVKVEVATQQELDLLANKILFERRQITQDVKFNTLINPTHSVNDSIKIYSDELNGVFVESGWVIPLVNGYEMSHTVSRLVDVGGVVI